MYQIEVLSTDSQFIHDTVISTNVHTFKNLKNSHLYSLRVQATNERGKSAWSSSLFITVTLPMSSVHDGQDIQDLFVNEDADRKLRIKSQTALKEMSIQLFDIQGSRRFEQSLDSEEVLIPLHDFSSGVYFLRINQSFRPIFIQ